MSRAIAFDPNFKNRNKGRRKGNISINSSLTEITGSVTFYNPPTVGDDQFLITSDSNAVLGVGVASAKPVFWVCNKEDILDTVNRLPGGPKNLTTEAAAYSYLASSNKYFLVKNDTLTSISTNGLVVDLDSTQKISYPTSGSVWYDTSGYGTNATLYNGPTFKSSVLNFDGSNDYAQINGNTAFSVDRRTVEITFRMNGAYANYSPLAVYANGSSTSNRIWLGLQNNKFQMHGWGTSDPTATTTIETGKWYTCVFSYDGVAEQMKMYTNGVLEKTQTQTEGGVTGVIGNNWYLATVPGGWQGVTYSNVSIKSFRVYNRVLTDAEVAQNFSNSKTSMSDVTFAIDAGNIMSNPLKTQKHQLAYSHNTWVVGSTSATGFSRNGASGDNIIEYGTGPFGESTVLWAGRNNDAVSDADGGWNSSNFPIRNTELYRFSVWVYRQTTGNGSFYLGTRGYNSSGTNTGVLQRSNLSNSTNPYFWSGGIDSTQGWRLVVGHIWPAGSGAGSNHVDSGFYNSSGTKVGNISRDYVWRTDNTQAMHRSYLYYSTNASTVQLWAYPRVDLCDGSEPSIAELCSNAPQKIYDLKTNTALNLKNNCLLNQNYIEFNGNNDAEVSLNSSITLGNGAWTVNVWVNGDSLNNYNILSNNNSSAVTNAFGFHTNKICYYHYNGSWQTRYGNSTLSTGKWYMLTWVNYSNSTMKMYVNGVPDSSTFSSTTTNGGPVNAIGRNWSTEFDGKLSSLYIYNKSFTDSEIGELFNSTRGYFGV